MSDDNTDGTGDPPPRGFSIRSAGWRQKIPGPVRILHIPEDELGDLVRRDAAEMVGPLHDGMDRERERMLEAVGQMRAEHELMHIMLSPTRVFGKVCAWVGGANIQTWDRVPTSCKSWRSMLGFMMLISSLFTSIVLALLSNQIYHTALIINVFVGAGSLLILMTTERSAMMQADHRKAQIYISQSAGDSDEKGLDLSMAGIWMYRLGFLFVLSIAATGGTLSMIFDHETSGEIALAKRAHIDEVVASNAARVSAIDQQISAATRAAQALSITSKAMSDFDGWRTTVEGNIGLLKQRIEDIQRLINTEIAGAVRSGQNSGKKGKGPTYENLVAQKAALMSQLDEIQTSYPRELVNRKAELASALAQRTTIDQSISLGAANDPHLLEEQKKTILEENGARLAEANTADTDGILARIVAVELLVSKYWGALVLYLVILFIKVLPTFLKMFSGIDEYDKLNALDSYQFQQAVSDAKRDRGNSLPQLRLVQKIDASGRESHY